LTSSVKGSTTESIAAFSEDLNFCYVKISFVVGLNNYPSDMIVPTLQIVNVDGPYKINPIIPFTLAPSMPTKGKSDSATEFERRHPVVPTIGF